MRELISNVLNREAEAIRELVFSLDEAQVDAVTETIKNCRGKVVLSACGTSAQAARKIALHFLSRPQTRFTADWV